MDTVKPVIFCIRRNYMGSDRMEFHEIKMREASLKKAQRQQKAQIKKESKKRKPSPIDPTTQLAIDFDKEVSGYVEKRKVENTVSNAIGWVGGKWKIGRVLVTMMPEHDSYFEVFFGGGSVFFRKPKTKYNAINDYNSNLINMYTQIRDNRNEFLKYINHFLYSRDIFDYCRTKYDSENWKDLGEVQRAVIFYYMIRVSFNNQMTHFSKDQMYSTFDEYHKIIKISEKLQGVLIENQDFRVFIEKRLEDKSGNSKGLKKFFYLDPP